MGHVRRGHLLQPGPQTLGGRGAPRVPLHGAGFSSADARERAFWDDYQRVYAEMLSRTSTTWAPWHVIPADHKWFARLAAAGALLQELMRIDFRYPDVGEAELAELRAARAELERGQMTRPVGVPGPALDVTSSRTFGLLSPAV